MKIFVSAVIALVATAATAQAGNLVTACGPVRTSSGDCVMLAHAGAHEHADCVEMMAEGPGKG